MRKSPKILLERYLAITRAIAGQMDFQSVLREIAGEVHLLFEHDHLDISILLPDQPGRNVSFEVGMSTKWGQTADKPHKIVQSPIRDLMTGKVPWFLTADAWNDERFHFEGAFDSPIFEANLRSRIHVPLHVHGVVQGTLNISSHQINKYSQDDIEIAKQVADLLAPYFYALIWGDQAKTAALAEGAARGREQALRHGTLRLTEGMENERKRIGMDLHDQTLADLTRILRRVSSVSRKPIPTASDLAGLSSEINNCVSELRRIIEDTKPGVMELFGFAQAVEAQLERSVAGCVRPIKTQVNDRTSSIVDKFPNSLRTTIFRIVQEAINNAIQHSDPEHLSVTVDANKTSVAISVSDDGSGTSCDDENSPRGMDNMRVRTAIIGGELSVSGNQLNGGTRVTVTVPLEQNPLKVDENNSSIKQTEIADECVDYRR